MSWVLHFARVAFMDTTFLNFYLNVKIDIGS